MTGGDPDTKTAIWHMFEAVENLFKLITGAPQMSAATIKDRLPAVLDKKYTEAVARQSAEKFQRSLQEWTDGAHFYRHAPGTEDPARRRSNLP